MEALARMLAQGNIDPRLLQGMTTPTPPRYEEPVPPPPPPPPPRLEEYYSPTTTPFPGQDTAPMPEPRYEQDTTPPAIYPLDTIAPQIPQIGGVTLSNGQFIAGVPNEQGGVNIGTPDFFQQYAGNPDLMRALSDAYGYDVSQGQTTQSPQIGYAQPDVQPQIGYAPQVNYNEPQVNPRTNPEPPMQDPRINPEPPRPFDVPQYDIGRRLG